MFIIFLVDSVIISSSCFHFHFEAPGTSNLLPIKARREKAGAAGAAALWVPAGTVCACRCLSGMCYLSPELVLSAYIMVPNISLRSLHRAVEVIFLIPLR